MSDWADINIYIQLNDHHTEADADRLISQIKDWADNDDGYAEDMYYEAGQRVIWAGHAGDCGFSAESECRAFLAKVAEQENTDTRLEWKSYEGEESCAYFGPHAGSCRIKDALASVHDQARAIEKDRDAMTPQLRRSIANEAETLLELAGATVNSRRLKVLRNLIKRDLKAAMQTLDEMIAELEIDEA